MTNKTDYADNNERSSTVFFLSLSIAALSLALIVAVGGLVYTANFERRTPDDIGPSSVITGQLKVSYMLVTSKTENSESTLGSTIDASRIEYFPTYVLVTTRKNVTILWTIEKLKELFVARESEANSHDIEPDIVKPNGPLPSRELFEKAKQ